MPQVRAVQLSVGLEGDRFRDLVETCPKEGCLTFPEDRPNFALLCIALLELIG